MTSGLYDPPWSNGAVGRGSKMFRQWSGGDATASEKQSRILLPHPYTTTRSNVNSPSVWWKNTLDNPNGLFSKGYAQELFGAGYTPPDPWTSNHWNALLSELYAECKGGEFNASVFTGTFKQTFEGIANAAVRIAKAYSLCRKGRLRDASIALTGQNRRRFSNTNKFASRAMASNWLELQYGWKPLIHDVYSATELLANTIHRPVTREFKVRKQATSEFQGPTHGFWNFGMGKTRHRCQIKVILSEPVSTFQKLGLNDPFTVAWELVPFSFVLDWFLPIGPWLEAANAARSLNGTFVVTHTVTKSVNGLYSGSIYQIQGGGSYTSQSTSVIRTIDTGIRPQIPAVKPLGKIASFGHCLNALALLENLRRR